jgi:hypothetical protein
MTTGRARRAVAGLALIVASLCDGCATFPPARPVPDISVVAGRWSGTIDFGRGFELFYLTINPDGSLVGQWGLNTRFGKVALSGGKATFQMYIWSGDLQYLEGDGKRVIILKDAFDTFSAQVTPLA